MRQFSAFGIVFVTVVAGFGVILASTPPARAAEFFRDSFDPAPLPGWGPSPLPSDAWHVANVTTDPCYATAPPNHPTAAASSPNAYAFHYDTSPPAAPLSQCTYDYGGGIGGGAQGFLTSPRFSPPPPPPLRPGRLASLLDVASDRRRAADGPHDRRGGLGGRAPDDRRGRRPWSPPGRLGDRPLQPVRGGGLPPSLPHLRI